jgi:hypothetical protein
MGFYTHTNTHFEIQIVDLKKQNNLPSAFFFWEGGGCWEFYARIVKIVRTLREQKVETA